MKQFQEELLLNSDNIEWLDEVCAGRTCDPKRPTENEPGFRYSDMTEEQRRALDGWIAMRMRPRRCWNYHFSSYFYKHRAEHDLGFYVSNLQFKVAMVRAGFYPQDLTDINHIYKAQMLKRYNNQ